MPVRAGWFCEYSGALHLKSLTEYAQGNGSGWASPERTETYAYETERDFLTSTTYAGTATSRNGVTDTWTYDAAGNRASASGNTNWTYDNLNRMSVSPKSGGGTHAYYHDILGNRTSRDYVPGQAGQPAGTARLYSWDILNRMTATAGTTTGARYIYRADGMRAEKITDISLAWVENPNVDDGSGFYDPIYSTNKPTTRYYYDGQMAMEEDYTNTSGSYVMQYGIGGRGIDFMKRTQGSTITEGFPLYPSETEIPPNEVREMEQSEIGMMDMEIPSLGDIY